MGSSESKDSTDGGGSSQDAPPNKDSTGGGGSSQDAPPKKDSTGGGGSSKDAPLNNNSTFRAVSDSLDKALGTTYDNPKESKIRATLHATYHEIQYHRTDNAREHERAKDQWNSGWGGPTDNLKKYDAARKQEKDSEKDSKKDSEKDSKKDSEKDSENKK